MKLPTIKKQLKTRAELEAFIRKQVPRTWDAVIIHDCHSGRLLKAAIEKIRTGGVLALKRGDHRILSEVFEERWTHYFCWSDDIIWTRICRMEGSSEVTWKRTPLAYVMDLTMRNVPFSYLRYGDGEWNSALETMCPGYGFQQFTPELAADVQDSLINYHRDPHYYMTLAPVHHYRDRGLYQWELMTSFLREHYLDIPWGCTQTFNHASESGKLWPFIQHLQQSNIIVVGPARYKALRGIFPRAAFVVVPDKQCHSQLGEIQRDILAQKHPAIVLITAGPACVVLIHRLYPHIGTQSTLIDIGSLWAPYIGQTEHGAHQRMLKIEGLVEANLGKG